MKNKRLVASDIKWNMTPEDRSMHLFYTIESIEESLKIIGEELDTENHNDQFRMAQLQIIEEQLWCMVDHITTKNKALQTA